ncbi:response regulator [Paenibacillus sp. IB182496]|uniref:Response regulator n=1 Tax=Paenibacillus sabuli TaxID=2772509 RepID=A0A927BRK3_9BACL|nr:response regulator [Paenibacillus sabuli]MBD2845471.1 response regulator [Paenibacillus sabuli]
MYYQVLLVDDEEIVCNGLRRFLDWEGCGYQVAAVANSVDQAIACLERRPVDLVITDIRMPARSGLELLELIREEYPDIIAIVLSGYGEFEYARQALRLGAADFLTKPVNFGELKRLLASFLPRLEMERIEVSERREYKQMKINFLLNHLAKGNKGAPVVNNASLLEPCLSSREFGVIRLRFRTAISRSSAVEAFKSYWMEGMLSSLPPIEGCERAYPFNNELYELAFLVFFDECASSAPFIAGLERQLERFQTEGMIGVSNRHRGMEHIHEAYREAGQALHYMVMIGSDRPAIYGEIEARPIFEQQLDETFSMDLLRMLASLPQRDDLTDYILGEMDAISARDGSGMAEVQSFCIQVAMVLNQHWQNIRGASLVGDATFQSLIHDLLLAPHPAVARERVGEWLTKLVVEMSARDDAESGDVIANIKRYIQEHYAENITLNSLSNVFYLHPIYLSRLFKEKAGLNFVEYLTVVRMNVAKELLLNPTLKVHDICQMIGYESPRYFTKLFKNATGMTPKAYREGAS